MIRIKEPAQMAEAMVFLNRAGDAHHGPFFRMAASGEMSFALVPPNAKLPMRVLAGGKRPCAVVLCDDDLVACGPSRFPQARKLFGWARAIVLHAAGGLAEHYEAAAGVTVACGRLVMVETASGERELQWLALIEAVAPRTRRLHITPPPGTAHPAFIVPPGTTVQ